jgi:oligopeptide/dipeptide ABC transporter ATP-binding protein
VADCLEVTSSVRQTAGGPLLSVQDLTIDYRSPDGVVSLVRDVSFDIGHGEVVCLVGESGSGKTLTGRAALGLLRRNTRMAVTGSVLFGDRDLNTLAERQLRAIRGSQIGMIFQDPVAALDPVVRVGRQVAEAITRGSGPRPRQGAARMREHVAGLLRQVGITDPDLRMRQFPHEISGGMCQRILIAIALAGNPSLLIADEPTTALDVTIQAQVLDLVTALCRDRGMSALLITHDMGVAARMADRVLVMYAGSIVEQAPTWDFFAHPAHPYGLGLVRAVPRVDTGRARRLSAISGSVPEARSRPEGCPFHPRCPVALDICAREEPRIEQKSGGQFAACHRSAEVRDGALIVWDDHAEVR